MRPCNKSGLLSCLEALAEKPDSDPQVDVKIFDGADVDPKKSNVTVKTFYDYADYVIIPYIVRHLEPVDRVDIVWIYIKMTV